MKKLLLTLLVLILLVLVAGCIYGPVQFEEEPVIEKKAESTELELEETTEQNVSEELTIEEVANESEEDVEKEPIDLVRDYLSENPLEEFSTLGDRIIMVKIMENETNVTLTYRISTYDPNSESTYLAGVLFKVFPRINATDIRGFNEEGKEIEAAKFYPTRDQYNFRYYVKWFGEVEYTECETDLDCDDNNECTKDRCDNGRCSNVEIVSESCI